MNLLMPVARFIVGMYISLYVLVHVMIFLTPETARYFVFQNYVYWPKNLSDPTQFDLLNVHNFYLDVRSDVRIGIWHYIPSPLKYEFEQDSRRNLKQHFDAYYKKVDNRPIIIYAHGNDQDRSGSNRVKICSNLCNLGYHVFALDYRGYGDSSGIPSEIGVVEDVITLFNFIKSFKKDSKVILWGHSLGTGVMCHVGKILSEFNSPPDGLILEAPFRNITQAARQYIIAPMLYNNPWIIRKSEEAAKRLGIEFSNENNIVKVKSKVLIFHAEDDWFVPIDRSRELVQLCHEKRPKEYPPVRLVEFGSHLGLGHVKLYTHSEMYSIVKEFIESK